MTIGERIREIRRAKYLTQRQLAEKLNVSYVNISQIERGDRTPKIDTLKRIADALEVNVGVLLYGPYSTTISDDGTRVSGQFIPQEDIDSMIEDGFEFRIVKLSDEQRILNGYRKLSSNEKERLIDYLDFLESRRKDD